MTQFGKEKVAATVVLCTALLCLASVGCRGDSKPPGWGDFENDVSVDGGEDSERTFMPESPPDESICEGDWCWVHPTPFGYRIEDLRAVGDTVYGLAYGAYNDRPLPFIWGEDIRLVDIPPQIAGDVVGYPMTIGQDGWLGLTEQGLLFEFGPDGVRAEYQLPERNYFGLEGHSVETFMVGIDEGGGYIRRGGELIQADWLNEYLRNAVIWPGGEVWRFPEADDQTDSRPEWRRSFPAPPRDSRPGPYDYIFPYTVGPNPSGPCASQGIWASFGENRLSRWDESSGTWDDTGTDVPGVVYDMKCRWNGTLAAGTSQGAVQLSTDGTWNQTISDSEVLLTTTAARDKKVYHGGNAGTLVEVSGGDVNYRGERLLPRGALGTFRGFTDLWVSPDESNAMVMHSGGIHRLTPGESDDVTFVNPENPEREVGRLLNGEIWGTDEPLFAFTGSYVFRWNGNRWVESNLSATRDRSFKPIDISGHGPADALVATATDLYHFDGESWRQLTSEGTSIQQIISGADGDISTVMPESGGGYLIGIGSNIYRLQQTADSWKLEMFKRSPCKKLEAMRRMEDGGLWVAGSELCVARSIDDGWSIYEPPEEVSDLEPYQQLPPTPDEPEGSWNFAPSRKSDLPLIGSWAGLLRPAEDGTLRREHPNAVVDLAYLPRASATIMMTHNGILAHYH